MTKPLICAAVFLAGTTTVATGFAEPVLAQPSSTNESGALHIASEIREVSLETTHLVRVAAEFSAAQIQAALHNGTLRPALSVTPRDTELASELGLDRFYFVNGETAERELFTRTHALESIAPAGIGTQTDVVAGDNAIEPLLGLQYAIRNTGQVVNGISGGTDADMDVSEAWAFTAMSNRVVVAVLDAGIELNHPEFAGKIVPGRNTTSIGTVDDFGATDDAHGTHVAGVIAASRNGLGTVGVAPLARIMPVKVVALGFVFEQWLADGIIWATDNGAHVIAMSLEVNLSGNADDSLLAAAVRYAHARNVVLVGSSGNVPGQDVVYPARFDEVIAVGATDNSDQAWPLTSSGPALSVVAPGVDVLSTWRNAEYGYLTGTSAACPQVAGAAALIRSARPNLTPCEITEIIQNTAEDRGDPGWDLDYGHGRVNSLRALAHAVGINVCPADVDRNGRAEAADFTAWLTYFGAEDLRADVDLDGSVSPADFTAWLSSFGTGCD